MPSISPTRPAAGRWIALLAVCLAVAGLSRVGFLAEPWINDAGIYVEMGKTLADGQSGLYREVWDTKFPGVPLLTAPLWLLFGRAWWGYVLTQAAAAIGAAFLLAGAARRRAGPGAYWPVLLTALVYLNLSRVVQTGFQLETLMAAFAAGAACCVLRALPGEGGASETSGARAAGWWVAAGMLAGLAALAKPTGLSVAAAAGAATLWSAWRGRRWAGAAADLAALAGGVSLILAPVAAWALTAPFAGELPGVYRQVVLYGTGTPWRQVVTAKTALLFALPLVPVAARLIHLGVARRRGAAGPRPPADVVVFAVAWLLIEMVGVVVQKRVYAYHFLPVFPPAALLCGLVPVRPRAGVMAAALLPAAALSVASAWPLVARLGGPVPMAGVIAYLDGHKSAGEAVWADPWPRLAIPTGLRPGARFAFTHYLINHDAAPAEFGARLLADLRERRPEWAVVLPAEARGREIERLEAQQGVSLNPARHAAVLRALAALRAYLDAHYDVAAEADGHLILRRRDR